MSGFAAPRIDLLAYLQIRLARSFHDFQAQHLAPESPPLRLVKLITSAINLSSVSSDVPMMRLPSLWK